MKAAAMRAAGRKNLPAFGRTRRALLTRLGPAALALPWLSALPKRAWAQPAAGKPKYFLMIYSPNGMHPPAFWPQGGERDFTLSRILEPLAPHRENLLVVKGLHFPVRPPQHQPQAATTGDRVNGGRKPQVGNGLSVRTKHPSIDQVIAAKVGTGSKFRSLEFGLPPAVGGDTSSIVSFAEDGTPLPSMTDPRAAFARLFEGVMPAAATAAPPSPQSGADERRRRAVSAFLKTTFAALERRIGSEDRVLLDAHFESLQETERRLLDPAARPAAGAGCDPTAAGPQGLPGEVTAADAPVVCDNFQRLIAHAFACDLTRVATLSFGYPGGTFAGGLQASWLGVKRGHHGISHHKGSADLIEDYIKLSIWITEQVSALAARLKQIPAPEGGTLFDHTLIYWFNRHGDGNAHANVDIPCVLIGGAGGAFGRMGRYLQIPKTVHASVNLSLANAMGLALPSFGLDDLRATQPIPGLVGA